MPSTWLPDTKRVYRDQGICSLCGRTNDLFDFELCSSCCHALSQAQEKKAEPDGLDNFIGWACRKLGVGTLPILMIVGEEAMLTHLMHHIVILPTSIDYEVSAFFLDVAKKLNAKSSWARKQILKHNSWTFGSRASGSPVT